MAKPVPYDDSPAPPESDDRDHRVATISNDEALKILPLWTGGENDPLYAISSTGGQHEVWVFQHAIANIDRDLASVKKVKGGYQLGKGTFTKKEIDELRTIRDELEGAIDDAKAPGSELEESKRALPPHDKTPGESGRYILEAEYPYGSGSWRRYPTDLSWATRAEAEAWGKRWMGGSHGYRDWRVALLPRGAVAEESKQQMDAFTRAYIKAALWSSNDESDEGGGKPLDETYNEDDIAPDTLRKMIADCANFQEKHAKLLDGVDSEDAGHNFWLSRNGHGAGFFDDGRDDLQEAAESYGQFDLYVGDDGLIHGTPLESRRATRESPQVADFTTLDDLIAHANEELGATHVVVGGPETKLYFPRGGQHSYEEARVWRKGGYWHTEGPGARTGVKQLPEDARPIGRAGERAAEEASGKKTKSKSRKARTAGSSYAYEQIQSDHFLNWVYDQLLEARRNPSEMIPLETKSDAQKIARRMFQQLEWDTKRDGHIRNELPSDVRNDSDAIREFFEGFSEVLQRPSSINWLADELLERKSELSGSHESTRAEEASSGGRRESYASWRKQVDDALWISHRELLEDYFAARTGGNARNTEAILRTMWRTGVGPHEAGEKMWATAHRADRQAEVEASRTAEAPRRRKKQREVIFECPTPSEFRWLMRQVAEYPERMGVRLPDGWVRLPPDESRFLEALRAANGRILESRDAGTIQTEPGVAESAVDDASSHENRTVELYNLFYPGSRNPTNGWLVRVKTKGGARFVKFGPHESKARAFARGEIPEPTRSEQRQLETRPEQRGVVRDYEVVDRRDRVVAGPFKSFGDAKQAAGTAGVVKFVPTRARETGSDVSKTYAVPTRGKYAIVTVDKDKNECSAPIARGMTAYADGTDAESIRYCAAHPMVLLRTFDEIPSSVTVLDEKLEPVGAGPMKVEGPFDRKQLFLMRARVARERAVREDTPFASWPDVMAYARTGGPILYKAPMDRHAMRFTPGDKQERAYKVRHHTIVMWPPGSVGRGRQRTSDPFSADAGHLSRFSRPTS